MASEQSQGLTEGPTVDVEGPAVDADAAPIGPEAPPEAAPSPPPPPTQPPTAGGSGGRAPARFFDDPDLDAAALRLDEHSRLLRGDVLSLVLGWKQRVGEQQQEALAAQRQQAAAQLAAVQQELECTSTELARQREVVRRMSHMLLTAVRWRRQHTLGCIAWRAWRQYTCRQRLIQANMKAAEEHYSKGKLRQGVFKAWRKEAASQLRIRMKVQAAAAVESERQRITQEAGAEIAQQAQRLAVVEAQLAAALAARQELEERMRVAFMRGVSALNIEAMALLKGGTVQSGGTTPLASVLGHQQQQAGGPEQGQQPPAQLPAVPAGVGEYGSATNQGYATGMGMPGRQQVLQGAAGEVQHDAPAANQAWSVGTGLQMAAAAAGACSGLPPRQQKARPLAAPLQPAVTPYHATSSTADCRLGWRPAAELPQPIISLTPKQPVPTMVPPPTHRPVAVRHIASTPAAGSMRPATALPCSLPCNVPPQVAALLEARGAPAAAASPARPATAPSRRQPSLAAQPVTKGQHHQQQQVSRRSLAGQQRCLVGGGIQQQPVVVRGTEAASRAQGKLGWP